MRVKNRKRPRNFSYASGGDVFITTNTKNRIWKFGHIESSILVHSPVGALVENEISRWSERFPWLQVIEHCVMPDHLHVLISWRPGAEVSRSDASVVTAVHWLKTGITMRAREVGLLGHNEELWQRSYESSFVARPVNRRNVVRYIQNNPRKWTEAEQSGKS
jgi:REP element-mobilizing transposase RayT